MASLITKTILKAPIIMYQPKRGLRLARRRFIGMSNRLKMLSDHMFPSLRQRMDELNPKIQDPELHKKMNIGYSLSNSGESDKRSERILSKNKKEIEKLAWLEKLEIDLSKVDSDWKDSEHRCSHARGLAEHFHIFRHLFNEYAFFHPVTKMDIKFRLSPAENIYSPAYYGNLLKPAETLTAPKVEIDSKENELWTLLMLNPDGNLYKRNAEVVHWFVGNIPGGKVEEGEVIVDYMRPVPAKGTGFHRYIFLLYKQKEKIDYSKCKVDQPCLTLRDRTFRNRHFYRNHENEITPSGLLWFQADYDNTLSDFFHHTLDMKEPTFEYDYPKPYLTRERKWPTPKKPFDRYLDLHADPKDHQKNILKERLSDLHPIKGDVDVLPYPLATLKAPYRWSFIWTWVNKRLKLSGRGKYRDHYRYDNRPPTKDDRIQKMKFPPWQLK